MTNCSFTPIYSYFVCLSIIVSDLSKAMLRVSSWVVTTGADSLAATCSSLGCTVPRRPKLEAALLVAPPFTRPGERAVRDETHKVSQNTSCLSWSTSITSALESEKWDGDPRRKKDERADYRLQIDRDSMITQTCWWGFKTQAYMWTCKRDLYWAQETEACCREKGGANVITGHSGKTLKLQGASKEDESLNMARGGNIEIKNIKNIRVELCEIMQRWKEEQVLSKGNKILNSSTAHLHTLFHLHYCKHKNNELWFYESQIISWQVAVTSRSLLFTILNKKMKMWFQNN